MTNTLYLNQLQKTIPSIASLRTGGEDEKESKERGKEREGNLCDLFPHKKTVSFALIK
jgi:hypothetical protein